MASLSAEVRKRQSVQWLLDIIPLLAPFEATVGNWTDLMIQAELGCTIQLLAHYPFIVALGMKWFRALVTISPALATAEKKRGTSKLPRRFFYQIQAPEKDSGEATSVDIFLDMAQYTTHEKKLPASFQRGFFGPRRLAASVAKTEEEKSRTVHTASPPNISHRIDPMALGYFCLAQMEGEDRTLDQLVGDVLLDGWQVDLALYVLKHGTSDFSAVAPTPRVSAAVYRLPVVGPAAAKRGFQGLPVLSLEIRKRFGDQAARSPGIHHELSDMLGHLLTLTTRGSESSFRGSTLPVWRYVLETCGFLVFDPAKDTAFVLDHLVRSPRDVQDSQVSSIAECIVLKHGGRDFLNAQVASTVTKKDPKIKDNPNSAAPLRTRLFSVVLRCAPREVISLFLDHKELQQEGIHYFPFKPATIANELLSQRCSISNEHETEEEGAMGVDTKFTTPWGAFATCLNPRLEEKYPQAFAAIPHILGLGGDTDTPVGGADKYVHGTHKLPSIFLILQLDWATRRSVVKYLVEQHEQDPRSTAVFIHALGCDFDLLQRLVQVILGHAYEKGGETARREAEREANGTLLVAAAYLGKEALLNQLFYHYPGWTAAASGVEIPNCASLECDIHEPGYSGETAVQVATRLGFYALRRNLVDRAEEVEEERRMKEQVSEEAE